MQPGTAEKAVGACSTGAPGPEELPPHALLHRRLFRAQGRREQPGQPHLGVAVRQEQDLGEALPGGQVGSCRVLTLPQRRPGVPLLPPAGRQHLSRHPYQGDRPPAPGIR